MHICRLSAYTQNRGRDGAMKERERKRARSLSLSLWIEKWSAHTIDAVYTMEKSEGELMARTRRVIANEYLLEPSLECARVCVCSYFVC